MITDIHCCDKSANTQCKNSCKEVLKNEKTSNEIVDGLIQACGDADIKVS